MVPVSTPIELDGKQDSATVVAVIVTSEQVGLLVNEVPPVVFPVMETK